ncbi:type II toxin-antitoxin system prevent-host-death family antitoxin [Mycetocola tolaasinivorans]|uniref:Type II toxin-antitoxin system prevent-host-death family antitoxin n=1 Tax=Mycetocola tolaasinivorans TaxID=76635 RepID=A0A3L7A9E4_9MICO|nr:type II toxin-antitoxin system prevent-host-death family antitoxin [Mycetocola tolaasinivorans]RLP76460.1 type II toxin-antitoxin system prevent-host-death family antitoxin [Mycetocola tolaasinivorans]
MSIAADYPTVSQARAHLKDVLDSVENGHTVTVSRDGFISAVLPAERLREYLFRMVQPRVLVTSEDGVVLALMEGRPFVSDGASVDEALKDLILSLREYAEDWEDHLQGAPNHAQSWDLVQLTKLSTDEQLRDWFAHGGE